MTPLVGVHRTKDSRWLMLSMLDEARYWDPTCRALGHARADRSVPRPRPIAGRHWPELTPMFAEQDRETRRAPISSRDSRPKAASSRSSRRRPRCSPTRRSSTTATRWRTPRTRRCDSPAAPAQFDDELPSMRRGGPAHGEHTVEVLARDRLPRRRDRHALRRLRHPRPANRIAPAGGRRIRREPRCTWRSRRRWRAARDRPGTWARTSPAPSRAWPGSTRWASSPRAGGSP